MWGNISIAFLLAFIATFMVTPYSIKIAKKIGAVDIPKDERRMRRKAIPKLGGIAIVAGFAISFFYLISVMQIEGSIDLFDQNEYLKKIIGIGLGIIIILITGILDDTTTLKPLQKLLGQVLAAIVVVSFGVKIDNINIPYFTSLGLSNQVSIVATIIWIVGITNAINLIDGLDGLSSGAILMITSLIGALVGFLPFNFAPAKTFLGDTGSNFLGYILSIISILGLAKTYTAVVIALPMLALGLPIFDVTWAIIRRFIKGKSIKAIFKAKIISSETHDINAIPEDKPSKPSIKLIAFVIPTIHIIVATIDT